MATHYQGTTEEKLALNAWVKLNRSSQTVGEKLTRVLEEDGVSVSQFAVLEVLHHLGPLCMKAIAEKILRTSGNLTLVVRNLERDKLVRRKQESRDRRYFTIHLTDKGEKLIAGLFKRHVKALVDAISALDPGEQADLARLCKKLGLGG